jgi:ABC-2 type transport system ATP-binding protein
MDWKRAGSLTRFVTADFAGERSEEAWRQQYPGVSVRTVPMSLREIFIVLARAGRGESKSTAA